MADLSCNGASQAVGLQIGCSQIRRESCRGCCKAPQTRSMVKGESRDAFDDAIRGSSKKPKVIALYYTCILAKALASAGIPGVTFPMDCLRNDASVDVNDTVDLTAALSSMEQIEQALEANLLDLETEEASHESIQTEFLPPRPTRALLRMATGLDAAWYITAEPLRDEVRRYLQRKVETLGQPDVLIGHSLGSMVGYDAIATDILQPRVFVTAGSPLAWNPLREFLPPFPSSFPRWINFWDRGDLANRRIAINWAPAEIENHEVSNPPIGGKHDLYGYLTNPTARSVLRNLVEENTQPA